MVSEHAGLKFLELPVSKRSQQNNLSWNIISVITCNIVQKLKGTFIELREICITQSYMACQSNATGRTLQRPNASNSEGHSLANITQSFHFTKWCTCKHCRQILDSWLSQNKMQLDHHNTKGARYIYMVTSVANSTVLW